MKAKKTLKRISLIVTIFIASFGSVGAQDFYHGLGAAYVVGLYNIDYVTMTESYSESGGIAVPGVFYKGTLALTDNFAVSGYPFIGLNVSTNSRDGGSGTFGIALPVNAEFYMGDLDEICFYAGGGLSWAYLASSEAAAEGSFMGPQVAAGGQFYLADNLIGLRASYTFCVNKTDLGEVLVENKNSKNMFSVGVYYPLGQ